MLSCNFYVPSQYFINMPKKTTIVNHLNNKLGRTWSVRALIFVLTYDVHCYLPQYFLNGLRYETMNKYVSKCVAKSNWSLKLGKECYLKRKQYLNTRIRLSS